MSYLDGLNEYEASEDGLRDSDLPTLRAGLGDTVFEIEKLSFGTGSKGKMFIGIIGKVLETNVLFDPGATPYSVGDRVKHTYSLATDAPSYHVNDWKKTLYDIPAACLGMLPTELNADIIEQFFGEEWPEYSEGTDAKELDDVVGVQIKFNRFTRQDRKDPTRMINPKESISRVG